MSGKEDVIKAIELQRQFPDFLYIKWTNIIETVLSKGCYTINEISRMLNLDDEQRKQLYGSMQRLKFLYQVRKFGNMYGLCMRELRHWKQKGLDEF